MIRTYASIALVAVAALTLPSQLFAQEAAPKGGATLVDLLHEVQLLRTEVQALQTNVDALTTNVDAISTNVQAMQDALAKQVEINDKLQAQIVELDGRMDDIARAGSTGSSSVNIFRSIQDDPKLRDDFQKVVQGKVVFENSTGQAHRMFINGAQWEVVTGRSFMYVPFGRVVIHTQDSSQGGLAEFTLDDWKQDGEQFVLNVPVLESR